jgi:hypothetical protein
MSVSVALSPSPILQFFDNLGNPCVGGSVLTQVGGLNYATYSEPTGTTALPNPIPLNSRGEVSTAAGASSELFLQTGVAYTFTLQDKSGNQLWSVGNITAPGNGNTSISFPTASGTANAQIVTNPVPISLGIGIIQWFLPVAANTAATTINVDNTGAKAVRYLSNALVGEELQAFCPAQIIYDGTNWNLTNSAKGPQADYYIDTGTTNALVVAVGNFAQNNNVTSDGLRVKVKAANTTTGNASLAFTSNPNINGNINLMSSFNTSAPVGSIIAGTVYELIFIQSVWYLLNPSRVTGSFTGTPTGMTTAPTATIKYEIAPDGNTVTMGIPVFNGTSNASTATITGMPSAIAPTTGQNFTTFVVDSGTATTASILIAAAGVVIQFGKGAGFGPGGFTVTGAKTFPDIVTASTVQTITYPISP